jgi:DNA-binding transcriptional LysR family regulator
MAPAPYKPTTLRQLRYFVAVAEEGQITRAANRLHLAQPALSQAIAQLESHVGVQLLERHARGVRLTAPGAAFFAKAKQALVAMADADFTAESLARAAQGALEVGYIGPAPQIKAPELFASLAAQSPEAEVSFAELPFPRGPTASWLREVDVALCHLPRSEPGMCTQLVRAEPRVLIIPENNPLARRTELAVDEVLDQVYIGYHPDVQPQWAGFHTLDDCRGGPPERTSADRPATPPDMLAAMASRRGITAVPACDAVVILKVLRGIAAVPLRDAAPFELGLSWRNDDPNPYVAVLAALTRATPDLEASAPSAADNGAVRWDTAT